MANQPITGQQMTYALCIATVQAFHAKGIQVVPHDRWNIELRGDEKDLCLLWYDLLPMCGGSLLFWPIIRLTDEFLRPAARNIADMILDRTTMPVEFLSLGLPGGFEISERCSDPQSGVTVHLFQYSGITNTMPMWVRLAYRIHDRFYKAQDPLSWGQI